MGSLYLNDAVGAIISLQLSGKWATARNAGQDQEVWVCAEQYLITNFRGQPLWPSQFDHVVIGDPRIDEHSQLLLENRNGLLAPDRSLDAAYIVAWHKITRPQWS